VSRHQYSDDLDQQDMAMWRGRVMSAIRGKRGQRLLTDLRDALDAMPEKRLVTGLLVNAGGEACALGALCLHRKAMTREEMLAFVVDNEDDDPEWTNAMLSEKLDAAECLIREIEYENDDSGGTPEQRWTYMRKWCERNIAGRKP